MPNVATLPVLTGQCSATAIAPTATDNCAGQITATTADPTVYNSQGSFIIHWNFNDGNGNVFTQNQSVLVDDNLAPVPNLATLPTISGECSASVSGVPTATDNCSGQITGTNSNPLTYNSPGTYPILWTYTDVEGNFSTQNQTVTVTGTVQTWFADADGDDFGGSSVVQCLRPANGFVLAELAAGSTGTDDCNDENPAVNPAATEICNSIDDDCDAQIDENVQTTFFADADGDGFGNVLVSQNACTAPVGFVSNSTDCDDADPLEFPGQTWFVDADGDDFGGSSVVQVFAPG